MDGVEAMIWAFAYVIMFIISFRYLVWFGTKTKIFYNAVLDCSDLVFTAFMALMWPLTVPLTAGAYGLSTVFIWLSDNNILQPLLDLINKWSKQDRG